jgi:hypothetical protein
MAQASAKTRIPALLPAVGSGGAVLAIFILFFK